METFTNKNRNEWHTIINLKARTFKEYLRHSIGEKNFDLLEKFSKDVDIFIFSGMIKDYILDNPRKPRDIDFTFRGEVTKRWEKIAKDNFDIKENRFGGFKLSGHNSIDCDVWEISKTYGINKSHIRKKPNDLLNSVFFNFTSIVYDYNSEKFIYDLNFLNFLQSRKIEIVNEENPDAELCFVNIYHNFKLYDLDLGLSVQEWAKDNYEEYLWFEAVQQRHFHSRLYTNIELLNFISTRLLK